MCVCVRSRAYACVLERASERERGAGGDGGGKEGEGEEVVCAQRPHVTALSMGETGIEEEEDRRREVENIRETVFLLGSVLSSFIRKMNATIICKMTQKVEIFPQNRSNSQALASLALPLQVLRHSKPALPLSALTTLTCEHVPPVAPSQHEAVQVEARYPLLPPHPRRPAPITSRATSCRRPLAWLGRSVTTEGGHCGPPPNCSGRRLGVTLHR